MDREIKKGQFLVLCSSLRGEWGDSQEGPWNSREDAETFARAEVGQPWMVVEVVHEGEGWK